MSPPRRACQDLALSSEFTPFSQWVQLWLQKDPEVRQREGGEFSLLGCWFCGRYWELELNVRFSPQC